VSRLLSRKCAKMRTFLIAESQNTPGKRHDHCAYRRSAPERRLCVRRSASSACTGVSLLDTSTQLDALRRSISLANLSTGGRPLWSRCQRIQAHFVSCDWGPVVAPGANRFSRPSRATTTHVLDDLNGHIARALNGGSPHIGVESRVVDQAGNPLMPLRPSGMTITAVRRILPELTFTPRSLAGDAEELPALRRLMLGCAADRFAETDR